MNWLKILFSKIDGWFHSPKAEAVETQIATLLPEALAIVNEIDAAAPNKTVEEFAVLTTKYALPAITAIADGQSAGNVALNIGTQILQQKAPGLATSIANTVIQLAVTAAKVATPAAS